MRDHGLLPAVLQGAMVRLSRGPVLPGKKPSEPAAPGAPCNAAADLVSKIDSTWPARFVLATPPSPGCTCGPPRGQSVCSPSNEPDPTCQTPVRDGFQASRVRICC